MNEIYLYTYLSTAELEPLLENWGLLLDGEGKVFTPSGCRVGRAVISGEQALLLVFNSGYQIGATRVCTWWPDGIIIGGAACELCGRAISRFPALSINGYLVCPECFIQTGLPVPEWVPIK